MASITAAKQAFPRLSPTPLAVVLLGHAGVLLAMLVARQASAPLALPHPLKVSLIELVQAPVKSEPEPGPRPAPPEPVDKPRPQAQVLAVERPTLLPETVPPAEASKPVAEPPPAASPAPAAVAEAARPASPQAPLIEPRFDANYLDNPKPSYPSLSRRLGEQGIVHLRVLVDADGGVVKLELKRGSGYARLDQSALDTVQNWHFVPAHQGAQAVTAWVVVPIHFALRN